jgi:hypothetical protein
VINSSSREAAEASHPVHSHQQLGMWELAYVFQLPVVFVPNKTTDHDGLKYSQGQTLSKSISLQGLGAVIVLLCLELRLNILMKHLEHGPSLLKTTHSPVTRKPS